MRLPTPETRRWQLLRAGIHNLWEYDDQRFVFHRGHLLLRGQNESGKTKALELLLPFVLDASLRPERLDPFGSSSRSMRWNLINDARAGEAVIGYVWLELGRREGDRCLYRTVGAGLRAKRSTPDVDDWYFETELRVDHDLALVDSSRVPLRRRQLEEAIGTRGRVFEKPAPYRAAVNELLFGMAEEQFEALIRALLELRRPQLSKALDPEGLSEILRASLPPLEAAAIGSLAEGFERLDRHREEREGLFRTLTAVQGFLGVYRSYVASYLKARALELTRAESAYHATREGLRTASSEEEAVRSRLAEVTAALEALAAEDRQLEVRLSVLRSSEEYRAIETLDRIERQAIADAAAERKANDGVAAAAEAERRARERLVVAEQRLAKQVQRLDAARGRARAAAAEAALATEHGPLEDLVAAGDETASRGALQAVLAERERAVGELVESAKRVGAAAEVLRRAVERLSDADDALRAARDGHAEAAGRESAERERFDDQVSRWAAALAVLRVESSELLERPARERRGLAAERAEVLRAALEEERAVADSACREVERRLGETRAERERVATETHRPPEAPPWRTDRSARAGAPLFLLCDFVDGIDDRSRAGIEAALEASGLLDAWVTPDGAILRPGERDVVVVASPPLAGPTLADVLRPDGGDRVPAEMVGRILRSIALGESGEVRIGTDGRFRIGPLHGANDKAAPAFIGAAARERARRQRLAELDTLLAALELQRTERLGEREAVAKRLATLAAELEAFPAITALEKAELSLELAAERLAEARARRTTRAAERDEAHRRHEEILAARGALAERLGLGGWAERPEELRERSRTYAVEARGVLVEASAVAEDRRRSEDDRRNLDEAVARLESARAMHDEALTRARDSEATCAALREAHGATREHLRAELAAGEERRRAIRGELARGREERSGLDRASGAAAAKMAAAEAEVARAEASRREAEAGFRRSAEKGLLPYAGVEPSRSIAEWSYTDALHHARAVDERTPRANPAAEARDGFVNRLAERHGELGRSLHDGIRIFPSQADGFTDYRAQYNGRDLGLLGLEVALADELAARERLLGEEEGKLFESFLTGEAHEHVRGRLVAAHELVERMNRELAKHPTSSGMQLRLAWEVEEDAPAGTAKALELLLRAGTLLTAANREELSRFLEQRLSEARAEEGAASLQEKLLRFLDYRRWHRFTVQFRNDGGDWKRLTKKLHAAGSGGQKAVLLHLPLFAAASAFYDAASPTSARLIMLDEAFAGIDRETRGQLMGLLVAFDLDFLMTSFEEWGFYKELDGISTYHLARERGMPGVLAERFLWNGREQRLVPA